MLTRSRSRGKSPKIVSDPEEEIRRIRREIKARRKLEMTDLHGQVVGEGADAGNRQGDNQQPIPIGHQQVPNVVPQHQPDNPRGYRSIAEMIRPNIEYFNYGDMGPAIEANNFELKPSLIQIIQNEQYGGGAAENPSRHLQTFVRNCSTFRINGVSEDAKKIRLFPFSLRGATRDWFETLNPNLIVTWEQLVDEFLAKFYPPSLTMRLRDEILGFRRRSNETFSESWEHFKELLGQCPHHQIPIWQLAQSFYKSYTFEEKNTLDSSAGGVLLNMKENLAFDLIEKITLNRANWGPEAPPAGGMYVVGHDARIDA